MAVHITTTLNFPNISNVELGLWLSNPCTGLFQEVEAPRFRDSLHMTVVRSAVCTGHLYPPGNIPGTHFC